MRIVRLHDRVPDDSRRSECAVGRSPSAVLQAGRLFPGALREAEASQQSLPSGRMWFSKSQGLYG